MYCNVSLLQLAVSPVAKLVACVHDVCCVAAVSADYMHVMYNDSSLTTSTAKRELCGGLFTGLHRCGEN
jgi:hypothetical protein